MRIGIVDKQPSNVDYTKHFPIPEGAEVEVLHLSSKKVPKLLKKDVDLDVETDFYDYMILVGSEATKYFTKLTSVTNYCGQLVNEKFIPVINPAIVIFKPESLPLLERAQERMRKIFEGTLSSNSVTTHLLDESYKIELYLESNLEKLERGSVVALDCETAALAPRDGELLGVSISFTPNEGAYISADALTDKAVELLQKIIDKSTIVFHNGKFDKNWLNYHLGLRFFKRTEDSILLHYALDESPGSHGLKPLAMRYTDLGDYDKELEEFKVAYCKANKIKQEDFSYAYIPFDVIGKYAAKDTIATYLLYNKFKPLVEKSVQLNGLYNNILLPASDFLQEMEEFGVPFSKDRLEKAQVYLEKDLFELKQTFYARPELVTYQEKYGEELNPNSPIQLRKLFFDHLNLAKTGKRTATGADSTDADVLGELAEQSEIPKMVLDLRQKQKIKSTYIDKIIIGLDRDFRLRTGFNIIATTSGRLSSSGKLNMQQLPRDNPLVKGCIQARDGYVICSQDLSTAEMFYAAVLSQDKNLMKVFQDKGDFHSSVAKMVFGLRCEVEQVKDLFPGYRQAAKAISFGILYGSGADKVAATVSEYYLKQHIEKGIPLEYFSKADAEEAIERYFNTYKQLKKWLNDTKEYIRENGFIYSHFGRKRRLRNVFSADKGIAASEVRSGLNFTIQSVASDINLLGAIDLSKEMKKNNIRGGIFALVHDSILAEIHEDDFELYKQLARECVQKDRGLNIPGVSIGVDMEVGKDYSFGKFEKQFAELV
jgi:DNA polymerase I-like protein with 3'-5' exonuclease and polymerase domains